MFVLSAISWVFIFNFEQSLVKSKEITFAIVEDLVCTIFKNNSSYMKDLLCTSCGVCAENCSQGVLGRRGTFSVPTGDSVLLSCVIHHCQGTFTGNWTWEKEVDSKVSTVKESARHRLTSLKLTANTNQLKLKILNANQSDEGYYRCSVILGDGSAEMGHWMNVNITEAPSHRRNFLHRIFVCTAAFLTFPIILGLARCLNSKVKPQPYSRIRVMYVTAQRNQQVQAPQPPPRRPVPKKRKVAIQKDHPRTALKPEVVYADISQDALRQNEDIREPSQPTIYSAVKFPRFQ